jgi:MFS transporter, DHA2 family, methylenomycin A resistance protein
MDCELADQKKQPPTHRPAPSPPANPRTPREPQDTRQKQPQGKHAAAALISVCLGFFVIQLDVTIVNVALPAIRHEIGGSTAGLQWVIDAYTLALASIMLTAGSAADRVGARKVFTIGLVAFAAGSAACAAAPSPGVLIAARTLQGLAASALLPCSLALLVHQFPDPRARARALGIWGGMGSAGVALGPVLGGALVAATGWRPIFLVNVPVCLATIVLLRRYVTESAPDPGHRTDRAGLVLGVLALSGLTGAFITAGQAGWASPLPIALLAAGLLSGVLFVRAEQRSSSPMLPLSLTVGLGSLASGRLTARFGPRPPMIAGLALGAAGAALLATAGTSEPLPLLVTGSVLLGLVSLAMPAMTAVVVGAAAPEHAGVASGTLNAARQAGGALGVAVLGSLLGSGANPSLHLPLAVAAAGYLLAIALAILTIPGARGAQHGHKLAKRR